MKRRLYQIVLAACQLGVVICFMLFTDNLHPGGILAGILVAAVFTSSIVILLDLPRGIIRWSVAALYAAVFATMFCLICSAEAVSPRLVAGAIIMGLQGCLFVAISVVIVKWTARILEKIARKALWKNPWKHSGVEIMRHPRTSDKVTKLKLNEVKPASDEPREPIFGPGAPGALVYVIGQLWVAFLSAWLLSSH